MRQGYNTPNGSPLVISTYHSIVGLHIIHGRGGLKEAGCAPAVGA